MNRPPPFDPARLAFSDPPPFEAINPGAAEDCPLVLCCDHASNAVPAHMERLGLSEAELERHIAWDIGAAEVTRRLAVRFGCPAFLSGYSRLIIDCNRPLDSPTSIPPVSDGTAIPANQALGDAERRLRQAFFFAPYQQALGSFMERRLAHDGAPPIFVAVHSFTPVMNGKARPWQIGLLYEHDRRLVAPMHRALLGLAPSLVVGENEPYAIEGPSDYAIPVYAQGRGVPHIELEIRQDEIAERAGWELWAELVAHALDAVIADPTLRRIERHIP
jgi:predicted N-formylglutamate amidohydrolase